MDTIQDLLADHPFFKGLESSYIAFLAGCASNTRFAAGEYMFREGDAADRFFLVRHGLISLETFIPGRGAVVVQTVGEPEVVGWSWLFPPFRWQFSAHCVELTRALAFDGVCLRNKCNEDHDLGYELMGRFASVMAERLHATRLQLLDVYSAGD